MSHWTLEDEDLKKYPHFDPVISAEDAMALALSPVKVAKHAFYPFMLYNNRWTKFAKKGEEGEEKNRPIRYAARSDAYIFARYRHALSEKYEALIKENGLSGCVLAYRRIPTEMNEGGKCNIHFAHDAFMRVHQYGSCFVITLDISSFFESIDHKILKSIWCRLIGAERLPPDHFNVFKAITAYSVVDKKAVYERLGHFGAKKITRSGKLINGYLTPHKVIPKQLCQGHEFRMKIAGGNGSPSIIRKNLKNYGIPQGAPISDLLANMYLFEFDKEVLSLVEKHGGAYFRYSDDIFIAAPVNECTARAIEQAIRDKIKGHGEKLQIKQKKSFMFECQYQGERQTVNRVYGPREQNGIDYLGFRYDGRKIYIRDGTLSNLLRKITQAARLEAIRLVRRYPGKDIEELRLLFNVNDFYQKFGRVEDFYEKQWNYRKWTFWTYAKRAAEIFGPMGAPIPRQLSRQRNLIRERVNREIERALTEQLKRNSYKAIQDCLAAVTVPGAE